MIDKWIPKYQIGDEVFIFIYSMNSPNSMVATAIFPKIIYRGKVIEYGENQYWILPTEIIYKEKGYANWIVCLGKKNNYHFDWVENFEPRVIKKIIDALVEEKIEKVNFT